MKSKALSLIVVLCLFSSFMSGCGQKTEIETEPPVSPSGASISSVVPEASLIAEAPESSSTPVVLSTPAVEESEPEVTTPLDQALEQAKEAFSNGYQVYLYDPQPKTVSVPRIDGNYKVSYILSEDATDLSGVMTVMRYVDVDGNKEIKSGVNSDYPGISTGSNTGYLTFNRALGPTYDQGIDDALKEQGVEPEHVEPAYIEVVLVGLTQGGAEISNTLKIQVEP